MTFKLSLMIRISHIIETKPFSLLEGVDGADGDRTGRVHPDRGRGLHLHHKVPIFRTAVVSKRISLLLLFYIFVILVECSFVV
jgi:hypothetical protein